MNGAPGGGSLSFDRAAEYYDETRGREEEVDRSVALLADQLPVGRPCLDVGVGTGRMALPLLRLGHDVVGIDLSRQMMAKLRAKGGGDSLSLAQADATRLPFRDDSFGAAYSIWVLHLVPAWERVLEGAARVTQPGGSVTVALGGQFGAGPWDDIATHFRTLTGARNVGAQNIDEVDAAADRRGWRVVELDPIEVRHEVTPAEVLRRIDEGLYSFTWVVDEATRREAVAATRGWAKERYGDLEVPLPNEFGAVWRRYEPV